MSFPSLKDQQPPLVQYEKLMFWNLPKITLKSAIIRLFNYFFSTICHFFSHNSDIFLVNGKFISHNYDIITHNLEFRSCKSEFIFQIFILRIAKSETKNLNCEIKSHNYFIPWFP